MGSEYAGSLSSDLASPISTTSSGGIDDLLSPNAPTSNTGRPRRHGNDNGGGGGVTFAKTTVEVAGPSGGGPTEQEDEEQAYSSGGVSALAFEFANFGYKICFNHWECLDCCRPILWSL